MPEENKTASKRRITPMVVFSTIAAVGATVVALNTFTGLNFRPAWGYEVEHLAGADIEIQNRLDTILEIQDSTSRTLLQLSKDQYRLRLHQIDRDRRELRRELAEYETRAEEYRSSNEVVPGWLSERILDTEEELEELETEKSQIENKLLNLE